MTASNLVPGLKVAVEICRDAIIAHEQAIETQDLNDKQYDSHATRAEVCNVLMTRFQEALANEQT